MNIPQNLRERINFQGEFEELFSDVATVYDLGDFMSFMPIEIGYEDLNIKLITSKGSFFVKIFAESRDNAECLRLINIVKSAIDKGVTHPRLMKHKEGYIFRNQYEQFNIRLAVFEWIEGKTFYELKRNPTTSELKEIIRVAAISNQIEYKPADLYDSWALVNFKAELEKARKFLSVEILKTLDKLSTEFENVDMKELPHSLVHGDLISTNIMKSGEKIYFVDFSVANYYPRIVELAVLMCDVMFDVTGKTPVEKYYKLLVDEYQKHIKLTPEELKALPLFIKLAHAMHVVRATREEAEGRGSFENTHWLKLGKKGLAESMKLWK